MADVGVFGRYKGFADFQEAEKANGLKNAIAMAQIKAYQAKAENAGAGENLPAALQIAKEYEARVKSGDIQGANTIAAFAKTVDKGLQMGADGNYYVAQGYAPALGEIAGVKAGAAQQAKKNVDAVMNPIIAGGEAGARFGQELTYAPVIQAEKDRAANDVMLEINQPKEKMKVQAVASKVNSIQDEIKRAKNKIKGYGTEGFVAGATQNLYGSPAFGLKKTLETVKANLGFAELQAMRDASPTGGALGQVAVQELTALQSTIANLDLGQKDKDLKYSLDKINGHLERWREAVDKSYQEKYQQPSAQDVFGNAEPSGNFQETLSKPVSRGETEFNKRKQAKSGLSPAEQEELNQLRARFKK
jgi:hypothetical protein